MLIDIEVINSSSKEKEMTTVKLKFRFENPTWGFDFVRDRVKSSLETVHRAFACSRG